MSSSEESDGSEQSILMEDNEQTQELYIPYNGVPITEFNIDSLPGDRPWRQCKTKKEIAEYFNYGFDEITFRIYQKLLKRQLEKQRQLRQQ